MITGRQIREARELLNMPQPRLAERAKLKLPIVARAEAGDGEPVISIANATAIQRALEAAGVEFTNGDQPGVRLRRAHSDRRTDCRYARDRRRAGYLLRDRKVAHWEIGNHHHGLAKRPRGPGRGELTGSR